MSHQLKADEFDTKVLKSDKPVLVDFFASWCGPCQMMAPVIDELSTELKDKAGIFKVDVEAEAALANRYQIMSLPTILVFKKGEVTKQFNGVTQKDELKSALEE